MIEDSSELAARIADAPMALTFSRINQSATIQLLSEYGIHVDRELPVEWDIPKLGRQGNLSLVLPKVKASDFPANHPIGKFVPKIHSLIAFSLSPVEAQHKVTLLILNPNKSVFTEGKKIAALQVFAKVLSSEFHTKNHDFQIPWEQNSQREFHETGSGHIATPKVAVEATERFLMSTLTERRRLLARNGIPYIGLRTWRAPIKQYQIEALVALKNENPRSFVQSIAREMAHAAQTQFGDTLIENVIPVPCGSSGRSDCLSVQVAETVAKLLKCNFLNVLRSSASRGKSHPRSSAKLAPFELAKPVSGTCLVIDDVATSGKHIELAVNCLRAQNINAFAMTWIAA